MNQELTDEQRQAIELIVGKMAELALDELKDSYMPEAMFRSWQIYITTAATSAIDFADTLDAADELGAHLREAALNVLRINWPPL